MFILLVFAGCKKETVLNPGNSQSVNKAGNLKTNKELINEAKLFFNKDLQALKKINANDASSGGPVIEALDKNADFDKAIVADMQVGKVVVTPVDYKSTNLYMRVGSQLIKASNYTSLFVYEDSLGIKHGDLVSKIPTEAYLKDTSSKKLYSGLVAVYHWNGVFKEGYKFENGNIIARLGQPERHPPGTQSKISPQTNDVKTNANIVICTIVEYYSISAGQQGASVKLNTEYAAFIFGSYTYCIEYGGASNFDTNGFNPGDYGLQLDGINGSGSGGCPVATGQSITGKKTNDFDPCAPRNTRQPALNDALSGDAKFLLPCDSLALLQLMAYGGYGNMYQQVAQYTAPVAVRDRIANFATSGFIYLDPFSIQGLGDATGPVVNSDFFPVNITSLPPGMTPASLTEYFRTHINNFISGSTRFEPYNFAQINDTQLWNQPGVASLGALIHIHLLDDGTVVESDYQTSTDAAYFRFTTLTSPLDGMHPVSGNREFGVYADPIHSGEFTFYTMGVDRTSNWFTSIGNATEIGFDAADDLWEDIQTNMINYINANGGQAEYYLHKKIVARPKWEIVREYLNGNIELAELKHRIGC